MTVEAASDGMSRVIELFQEGCLKTRLPNLPDRQEVQLVLMNTAGGLTGGDWLSVDVNVGDGACATVTTPACERIYRSSGGEAVVRQHLRIGIGGRLDWLPQETIIYNRSRLSRRLDLPEELRSQNALISLREKSGN